MKDALSLATDGPCAGHACDQCSICRRGRCCRRDRPDYRLPTLGDWKEPIVGQLGVLATDGEKVRCHICGRYFRYLANHVWRTHDMWADQYRAFFGLNVTTGLVGPATRALQAQIARQVFHDYWDGEIARTLPIEQRNRYKKGRSHRLESKLHPELKEQQRERARQRHARGEWQVPGFPPEASSKGVARFRELMQDPEYRAEFSKKAVEARGARVQTTCVVCGISFETVAYVLRKGLSKTCSKACFGELRRRYVRDNRPQLRRPQYVQTVAKLQALDPDAFARLPEDTKVLVQRYFGLTGEEPQTLAALGADHGLGWGVVRTRIVKAVAQLLGE